MFATISTFKIILPIPTTSEYFITNMQRLEIYAEIRKCKGHKTLRYGDVADWDRVPFKLSFTLSCTFPYLLDIVLTKTGDVLHNDAKRSKKPYLTKIEKLLLQWFIDQNNTKKV